MNFKSLVIGDLCARIPIVQGGMGIGVSLSGLAGAVAAAGGIGVISSAQIGYADSGFEKNPVKANIDALARHIRIAREKAAGGIIGVNIMVAMKNYDRYVKTAIENGIDIIFSGAGLPVNLPELVKGSGVKIAPIVSSLKAAKILVNRWIKIYDRKPDAIVVEGPMAGGHLGFKAEYFDSDEDYDAVLTEILDFAGETPVIFAGGVYDKADIVKYLEIGCKGVQISTRFVATNECDAHENFKESYIKAGKDDIVLIKSPVGMPGRAIKNNLIKSVEEQNQSVEKCYGCLNNCDMKNTPYCISKALISAVKGDTDNGLLFCGKNAHRVKEIVSVEALFRELVY